MKNLSYLGMVRNGNFGLEHYIDTQNDSTYLIDVATKQKMFTVNSDACLFDADGERIGKFNLGFGATPNHVWTYVSKDGKTVETINSSDLLLTERAVFAKLLEAV